MRPRSHRLSNYRDETLVRLVRAGSIKPVCERSRFLRIAGIVSDDTELFVRLVWLDGEASFRTTDTDPVVLILDRDQIVGGFCFYDNVISLPFIPSAEQMGFIGYSLPMPTKIESRYFDKVSQCLMLGGGPNARKAR